MLFLYYICNKVTIIISFTQTQTHIHIFIKKYNFTDDITEIKSKKNKFL